MGQITKNVTQGNKSNKKGLIVVGITAISLIVNLFFPENEFSTYILAHSGEISTIGAMIGSAFVFLGKK